MFHEFGHGLHGMLSRARLKSQAGTNVDRDFVELPSQIHEHWAFEPEMLRTYAHHWQTGDTIPAELIAKIEAAATHNQGFTTAELVGAALLDLQYGKFNTDKDIDIAEFEQQVSENSVCLPNSHTAIVRPTSNMYLAATAMLRATTHTSGPRFSMPTASNSSRKRYLRPRNRQEIQRECA